MSRREVLIGLLAVGSTAALAGCSGRSPAPAVGGFPQPPAPSGPVAQEVALTAGPVDVDLGGRVARTWAYNGKVPGEPIRATVGDRVRIAVRNELPAPTSVHWHGLAIPNSMDGVPGVTTPAIDPNTEFTYDFVVPDAGTHWFHPHTGLQLDTGLYAPFIVTAREEPGAYDHDWIVVLDDWTDGVGRSPEQILADLQAAGGQRDAGGMNMGSGMGGMDHGGMMSGGGGDVDYPLYLINGRTPQDPQVLRGRPGDRVRLRVINSSADTIFRVALADHTLRITHTDGYPVLPVESTVLRLGMGERYDVLLDLGDGAFAVYAEPEGKSGAARAIIRTSATSAAPLLGQRPPELNDDAMPITSLTVAPGAALPPRAADSVQPVALAGGMGPYVWTINGRTYENTSPLTIKQGQAGRLQIGNHTMMAHPLHLHGHTFQIGAAGGTGVRKDTVLVDPMSRITVDFVADNPGAWMVHCHNAYHAEAGMMTRLEYTT